MICFKRLRALRLRYPNTHALAYVTDPCVIT